MTESEGFPVRREVMTPDMMTCSLMMTMMTFSDTTLIYNSLCLHSFNIKAH